MDDYRVPIEYRWLGLDKRRFPIAIVVAAFIALMIVVIPAIDSAVSWDDEIRPGDVIDMGGGTTFVPPVGWNLEDGIRASDEPAVGVDPRNSTAIVVTGGVSIVVRSSDFGGDADELLDQVNKLRSDSRADEDRDFTVTGARTSDTTASGLAGVSEAFTSATGDGRIVAFTYESRDHGRLGLTVTIETSRNAYATHAEQIEGLLASISVTEATS